MASDTIDFQTVNETDLGTTPTDGTGGSTDIPGRTIEIYSADESLQKRDISWIYSDKHLEGVITTPLDGIVGDLEAGDPVIVIRSADGSEFSFQGIDLIDHQGVQSRVTIEGFLNGDSLGSVTLEIDTSVYNETFSYSNGLTSSIFQYVDEIRITNPDEIDGLGKVNYLALDEIVIGPPVPPADMVGPSVISVSAPTNGTYAAGQALNFTVNFDEAVTVDTSGGAPRIAIDVGGVTVYANYQSGSGTGTLTFRYVVQTGDVDSNGIALGTSSLQLNGSTLKDAAGNDATLTLNGIPATAGVYVDAIAPVAPSVPDLAAGSDTGISNTDNLTNDATPTFSGTGEPGTTVHLYADGLEVGSATVNGSGNWTVTAMSLGAGTFTYSARVQDAAGNLSDPSPGTTVTIDTSGPTVSAPDLATASDTGDSNTDNTTNIARPTFTGTAPAGTVVYLFIDYVGNGNPTDPFNDLLGTFTVGSDGTWSITPTSDLDEGTRVYKARGLDEAGNFGPVSATLWLTVDRTPPAVPATPDLVSGSDTGRSNSDNITIDTTPTFTGSGAELASVVRLYADGVEIGSGVTDDSGNWTITPSTPISGTHAYTVRTTDSAGNVSESAALTVTIDTVAPAAPSAPDLVDGSDAGASSTDNLTSDTTPTFSGTAEAGSTVRLYADGLLVGTATADGAGNWTVTASNLSSGTYTFTTRAEDAAGNLSPVSSGTTVTIDATAPAATPSASTPADNSTTVQPGDNITLRFSEPVVTGAGGNIILYNQTDGTVLELIPYNSPAITGWGTDAITINPSVLLPEGKTISVRWDGSVFQDASGNFVAVNVSGTFYDFVVADTPVAPTATNLTQALGFTEDGASVNLGDIVVTDPNAGEVITATLTLSNPAAGFLSVGTYGSATATFNAGIGVWTVTGSVTDVNDALAAVQFTPAPNWDQDVTITTRIRDAAGMGPEDGAITLSATPVNDAPVATAPASISVMEDTPTPLTGISFSDADAGSAPVTVTFSVPAGSLSAISAPGVTVGGSASALTLTGTITDINAFLAANGVVYAPAPNDTTTRVLTVSINDNGNSGGGALSDTTTINLGITAVNDVPTVTVPAIMMASEDVPVALTGITVSDADAASGSVTVTFSVPEGMLAGASGGGVTIGGTAAAITLTGTVADINAYIAASNLTYTGALNASGEVNVHVSISDHGNTGSGGAQADSDDLIVRITPVNDAPVLTGAATVSWAEGNAPVAVAASLTISDVDSSNIIGASVTLSDFRAGDVLAVGTPGPFTASYDAATGVLTLTGTGSRAQIETALRSVTFASTSEDPTAAGTDNTRLVEIRVTDDGTENKTSAPLPSSILLTGVNDRPVAVPTTGPAVFTPGAGPASLDPAIELSDTDSANLTQAIITLSSRPNGTSELLGLTSTAVSVALAHGLTVVYNGATGVLTVTGTASVAAYEQVLRGISYNNDASSPDASPRTITFSERDDSGDAATQDSIVVERMLLIDSLPTVSTNTGATVAEGSTGTVISASMLTATDVETPDPAQIIFTLTTLPSHGVLHKGGVALGLNGTFTQQDIDSGLITFTHGGAEASSDSFGFSVTDAAGVVRTGQTFAITVSPVNDAAVIAGTATGAVVEDAALVASGTLTVTDAEDGEAGFQAQADVTGTYGTFAFDAATGQWTYTLDNAGAAVQALREGEVRQETFTVKSLDGTMHTVTVVVTGTKDADVIDGVDVGRTETVNGDGSVSQVVTIPVVRGSRSETDGDV
uniref:beta strand repeat-containing protein n=1 Tax=Microvirga roseola TaxID=2883126 RepID=UPI001E56D26E